MNSRRTTLLRLVNLVERIRNVCILAHVDHGKTTIADALLATNGIVSARQSGKLRYMDNTEAEQERGITMKSSVIGLVFNRVVPTSNLNVDDHYLINLVDSPGHVDFSSEVSTAVRLCDAAVIVVDVVEGVCPQTRTVLRQAWNERLTLILTLNKIDRLILELQLTPTQAYETIYRVIEQVNAVLAEMFSADVMRRQYDLWQVNRSNQPTSKDGNEGNMYDWSSGLETTDDSNLYFSPERGNVIFSSGIDSWGFTLEQFSYAWFRRLNISQKNLTNALWGDFYISTVGGEVKLNHHAKQKNKKPLFVQLVLEPLWNAYQTLLINNERDKVFTMADKLGIQIDRRSLRNVDSRGVLRSFLSTWLPLGSTIMLAIVDICPSPSSSVSADRAVHMLYGDIINSGLPFLSSSDQKPIAVDQISHTLFDSAYSRSGASQALQACSSLPEAPTIVFVAKVFWIDKLRHSTRLDNFSRTNPDLGSENSLSTSECTKRSSVSNIPSKFTSMRSPMLSSNPFADADFIALARVFSGSVYCGQKLFVLGPKFDGNKVPLSLLDVDPNDFPLGPVRLPNEEDDDSVMLGTSVDTSRFEDLNETSPVNSVSMPFSHSGSVGGSSGCKLSGPLYLRHVYVASIVQIFQLLGGQSDLVEIPGPVPSGNIIGITGPDLIACLPKSGLLVSRLSLVAGINLEDPNSDVHIAPVLPLAGLATWRGAPVISVAVEPASAADPEDVCRLERGLRLLDRADPCAEIKINSSGEYIISAAGEIHLQKCLEDLTKYFAPNIELQISPFVVGFRETIIDTCTSNSLTLNSIANKSYENAYYRLENILNKLNLQTKSNIINCNSNLSSKNLSDEQSISINSLSNPSGYINNTDLCGDSLPINLINYSQTSKFGLKDLEVPNLPISIFQLPHSKSRTRVLIRVTTHPLPQELIEWVKHRGSVKIPQLIRSFKNKSSNYSKLLTSFEDEFFQLCSHLALKSSTSSCCPIDWKQMASSLLAIGPNHSGTNMLFSRLNENCFPLCTDWGRKHNLAINVNSSPNESKYNSLPLISYGKALLRGFQLATQRGPLCAEPMYGVLFILEEIVADDLRTLKVPQKCNNEQETATVNKETEESACELNICSPQINDSIDQITISKHGRKSRRLTSISWVDDNDKGDFSEIFQSESDDNSDWCSSTSEDEYCQSNEISDQEQSNNFTLQSKDNISSEEIIKEIPYWQRRSDTDWLYDIPPGLLTPAMARACLSAFQACPSQRLMLSVYDVELQARGDVLGRMFAVLRKRHARIINEDFREGENTFLITARLPIIESLGLAEEIRSRTSGIVSLPQLRPGGWELLDIDPLQKDPNYADKSDSQTKSSTLSGSSEKYMRSHKGFLKPDSVKKSSQNDDCLDNNLDDSMADFSRVQRYIREVRLRKGLSLNEQLVLYADKQRTLKKNK